MTTPRKQLPRTDVPWADYQWPILRGCSPISDGCQNCYAETWHRRFAKHMGIEPWGQPHFIPHNLDMPFNTKKPGRVFVAPMSDLGHGWVSTEWRSMIVGAMMQAPWHTYIVLTKRPGPWLRHIQPDCWCGVSVESPCYRHRWQDLLTFSWPSCPVRFVSAEPLLAPLSFRKYNDRAPYWIIAGPETGRKARPCKDEWIDALAAESPCFFDKRPTGTRREFPTCPR
jgi:protein gp37